MSQFLDLSSAGRTSKTRQRCRVNSSTTSLWHSMQCHPFFKWQCSACHTTMGGIRKAFPWSVVRCSKRISYSLEDVDQAFCSPNFWYLLNYDKMKKFLQNKKGRYSLRQNKPGPRYPPKDICKCLVFKNLFVGWWWWLSAAHLKSVKVCMEANVFDEWPSVYLQA